MLLLVKVLRLITSALIMSSNCLHYEKTPGNVELAFCVDIKKGTLAAITT